MSTHFLIEKSLFITNANVMEIKPVILMPILFGALFQFPVQERKIIILRIYSIFYALVIDSTIFICVEVEQICA